MVKLISVTLLFSILLYSEEIGSLFVCSSDFQDMDPNQGCYKFYYGTNVSYSYFIFRDAETYLLKTLKEFLKSHQLQIAIQMLSKGHLQQRQILAIHLTTERLHRNWKQNLHSTIKNSIKCRTKRIGKKWNWFHSTRYVKISSNAKKTFCHNWNARKKYQVEMQNRQYWLKATPPWLSILGQTMGYEINDASCNGATCTFRSRTVSKKWQIVEQV